MRAVTERFEPTKVLAWGVADGVPLMADRSDVDGRAAAYVCRNFACERPVTEPADLVTLLEAPA